MPEFKSKEEYERWKTERAKATEQTQTTKSLRSSKTNSGESKGRNSSVKKGILIVAIALVVLIPAIIFLKSYMTHGKISGNVYVSMKAGDVKRAAGIEMEFPRFCGHSV
jgi:hypothetical protein